MLSAVRTMKPGDVCSAMELSTVANWNQTPEDWRRMMLLSAEGCRCIEDAGSVIATASLLRYGSKLAWIGMVLTQPEYRSQGLAGRLVEDAIAGVDRGGVRTVKLDATDEGRPLYESLGFIVEKTVERWGIDGRKFAAPIGTAGEEDDARTRSSYDGQISNKLFSRDAEAFGVPRQVLLEALLAGGRCNVTKNGYVFSRPGRTAQYLGPCVASSDAEAGQLIAARLGDPEYTGEGDESPRTCNWYWDLLPANPEAVRCAAKFGFTRRRRLWRMFRGEAIESNDALVYAITGFEWGCDIVAMRAMEGDVLILGVGGKMGPTLAQLIRRSADAANKKIYVMGVTRFSDKAVPEALRAHGVEPIVCDLLEPEELEKLPDAENVIFMAARKFGTTGSEHLSWAINTQLPTLIADRYRKSRIVCFSSGNVYPLVPVVRGGASEQTSIGPQGEYAQSVLGRERIFEHASHRWGTRVTLLRLNYAMDLRYGVLVDIPRTVFDKRSVDLRMPLVNVIWQGDANSVCMRSIPHCASPPFLLNLTGPVIGFYLQPSAGGRPLSYHFWREFSTIDNVVAIKMAPFNRYQTIDVLRGVLDSVRALDISLYTGNDDNILVDLLTRWNFGGETLRIAGGLLGHWTVWTSKAVEHLALAKQSGTEIPAEMLTLAQQITDANSALFDPAHWFAGCVAGIHEVLRRQGLLEGIWCLDEKESLSSGQSAEIDRVSKAYPHLSDDTFVRSHLDEWLR